MVSFCFFFLKVLLIQNIHCPYLMFVILYLQTQLSWATLLVRHVGGFNYQETHQNMVRLGLSLAEDDILYNMTNIDSMHKSFIGIPFKGG